ncbi:MoeA3: molybdopterin biosynthesis protein [Desulfosarcina variabilis str. Montpellier]|uniref:molybdopterin molybdotransferase MoeA n=1 Tax=Desulfosarcina variabilis TaxID=2300 RepID=UPI003AFB018F
MIDLKKAQQLILEATPVLGRESVPILDTLNRVLAQDIVAVEDLPITDISAMDGYAVRHQSLVDGAAQETVKFRIIGESPAGRPCGAVVGDGQAVRIMTGGLVPEGADTVIKIEDTVEKDGTVICTRQPERGDGIRFKGDSLKKGDIVLRAGDVVSPIEVGALASLRRAYVYVHRKPVVAILSTGDELSDFHEPPSASKAMCSNLYTVAAQVLDLGAIPLMLGIVADDIDEQRAILLEALRADVIVTSGGTSRGKYDLVHKAFAALGMEIRFSNIFAKPGKPTTFGTIKNSLIFGLPGNPSATMLSFDQFIKPALLKMMGYPHTINSSSGRTMKNENSPFSRIDSFNTEHGGNKDHKRASQVPLQRTLSDDGSHLQKKYMACDLPSGHLKIVAK